MRRSLTAPAPNALVISPSTHQEKDTSFKGTMYDFTDPQRMGPGMWHVMHIIGKWADGDKTKEEHAAQIFESICENFKCGECNGHCNKYVKETNPPRNHIGKPNGLFHWTIDFRNAVQSRKGRQNLYDKTVMGQIYTDATFYACTEGCESKEEKKQPLRTERVTSTQFDIYAGGATAAQLSRKAPYLVQPVGPISISARTSR